MRALGVLAALLSAAAPAGAGADHAVDVERLAAKGDHLAALVAYRRVPRRRHTTESHLAAGRSAWALGLPAEASEAFDRVLAADPSDPEVRAGALMSRGVLEFQEGRYRMADVYARRTVDAAEALPGLKAKALLLLGHGLSKLGEPAAAETAFSKAAELLPAGEKAEARFLSGECLLAVGRTDEARARFEAVPPGDDRHPAAVRHLARIALAAERYDEAETHLKKGQRDYPEFFLDPWVDYALLEAAVRRRDTPAVRAVRARAKERFPASDQWLTLLEAAAEAYEWGLVRTPPRVG